MTFCRSALAPFVLVVMLGGCAPPLGRVLVTVAFENETRTQCIKSTARNASGASINSNPAAVPREGKDTLRIGLGETPDLVGELQVTISRFSSADCTGTAFDTETKPVTVTRGAALATVEFRFVGMTQTDAGMDAGVDAGTDAGCDVGACGNAASECEMGAAIGCNSDGGCRYSFRPSETRCGDGGVCNSMGACIANVCAVQAPNSACEDGLPCTGPATCQGGQCRGSCPTPPLCKLPMTTPACDPNDMSLCAFINEANGNGCGGANKCLDGTCVVWPPFTPVNFPSTVTDVPYPTAPWNVASPDGGVCDTVISTTGTTAMQLRGDCNSSSPLTSVVNDAGVMVITSTGLDVGPNARLHFVGDKPVQLLVLGSASIRGVVSVAPLIAGEKPAGSGPAICDASPGTSNEKGGGGGGFGGTGGTGGDTGGSGGSAASAPFLTPFRGGCPGASGYLVDGGASEPGMGGGAIHLIVADSLTLDGGIVTASGNGGAGAALNNEGAAGGGSGGTVILEARTLNLNNGAVTTNGGAGGQGGDTGNPGIAGANGPLNSSSGAPTTNGPGGGGQGGAGGDNTTLSGTAGTSGGSSRGGGGGGGAAGVVFVRGTSGCVRGNGILSGAPGGSIICQ